jgi:phosphate transport system substrate-binding protein
MKNSTKAVLALVAVSTLAVPAQAQMRRNIRIVGSSTVYPFSKAVAERFSRTNPAFLRRSLNRRAQAAV